MRQRAGFTMLELTVVLAIVATLTTVTALRLAGAIRRTAPRTPDCATLRRRALARGVPVHARGDSTGATTCGAALFLPDGRVLSGSGAWDPLTGDHDATR